MSTLSASSLSDNDMTSLFHALNNHLGIILANAELLEHRLVEEQHRARAGQVVASALDAIQASNQIRQIANGSPKS
ncbi:MAG: hypothetical protein O2917_00140 [Acidobacteria bacterium]|nr:hypothetical protein [Acidobacteriota bacterium]